MLTFYAGYSIAVTIREDKVATVKNILKDWSSKTASNGTSIFSLCPSTLFVSGVVVPEQSYHGELLPATLLLFTSFCGDTKKHLDELVSFYAPELRNLLQHCLGFPCEAATEDKHLKRFLRKQKRTDTFFSGIKNITFNDISREESLRREISKFLDQGNIHMVFNNLSPTEIREQIQNHVREKGDEFGWIENNCKRTFQDKLRMVRRYLLLVLTAISLLIPALAIFIILAITYLLLYVRIIKIRNEQATESVSDEVARALMETQLHPVINEVTIAGPLKKGLMLRVICLFSLNVASTVIKFGRSIPTIATARWISLNKGKRLAFISNFTNTSRSYVRDFIDCRVSAMGVNFLFGNGCGYPATRWLVFGGALDSPDPFMNVFEQNQHITQFWYCPYPHLSVDNINNNHKIRVGLFSKKSDEDIRKWLLLL